MRVGVALVATIGVAAAGLGAYAWNNLTYADRDLRRVADAGFTEQQVTLPSGTELNYAEGPDNGPALLLLHAQASSWESYARVLPSLARDFHVYAIDFPGHGDSADVPGRYDVHSLGEDVASFVSGVIHEPVILSGHSSGGLVAAWVMANAPALVTGAVLEDPPLFSTDPARMPQQFNYVDLARPAHEFLADESATDFARYYLAHNAWIRYFGGGRDGIVSYAQGYRDQHPDEPLKLWFLPPVTNESFAHMHEFDPAFADAFYTLEWQAGLDQADTLRRVEQPTILVHANWRITDDGILEGAMTDDDAARACALMADCTLARVDTGHGFHFERPRDFVALIRQVSERVT